MTDILEDADHDLAEADYEAGADEQEPTVEEEARSMGWHPLAEFRGPPDQWVDAETFVRRGRTEMPILRNRNRALVTQNLRLEGRLANTEAKLAGMDRDLAEARTSAKESLELARRAEQRGYDRARAEIKERQRAATAAGDVAEYDAAEAALEQLEATRPTPAPAQPATAAPASPPAPPPVQAPPDPAITAFVQAHADWWDRDLDLTQSMIEHHATVRRRFPNYTMAQQLDEAFNRLRRDYPDKLGDPADDDYDQPEETVPVAAPPPPTPRRAAPAAVARPASPRARVAATAEPKGFDRIPDARDRAEAKAAFERARRNDPKLTADEYVDLFLDPHGDVLDAQRRYRK